MASKDSTGVGVSSRLTSGDLLHAGLVLTLFLGVWRVDCLELNTGKIPYIEAMNGSTVLIPCTYASCIGIKNLLFNWHYNDNGTLEKLVDGFIADENTEPITKVNDEHPRVQFVGTTKTNNISILLWNITFEDDGQYIAFAKNPKEKGRNHTAIFTLRVVDELKEIDNTLTTIIVSVVGGVIGSVILIMVIKALVIHFVFGKDDEKTKECLVSSGNDNTENGLSGAKADNKGTPKA